MTYPIYLSDLYYLDHDLSDLDHILCNQYDLVDVDHDLPNISFFPTPLFFVAVQQHSCSSQEIQPSTWLRIASLHLAETLRPTALPHGSALHL